LNNAIIAKWNLHYFKDKHVLLCFFLQFTDYDIVAEGYGGAGLKLGRASDEEIVATLEKAQELASEGKAVLINALIGKSNFREGSISV
jgi:thiamine pyrophosphate-dependent acetolactate synthase large subunit-like protein